MSHLKDPTTQYYTGEYPKQKQPTPGIQAKMTPVPDCGEKTYVGSGRLKDRKALVTGGICGSVALPPSLTRVKGLTWRSVIFPWKKKTPRM
ncbi:hypothetical protein ACLK18_17035 [Escherichia coli]